jgi:GNAT superfamily N-acetyltransferase
MFEKPIHIRPAASSDRELVVRLAERFAESALPPWRSKETIARGTERQVLAALQCGNGDRSVIFVAERDGRAEGFAWAVMLEDFYTGEPLGKVSEIAVSTSGQGVGEALLRRCEAWAIGRGAKLMTLNALQENARAISFYEHRGYAPEYTMFVKRLSGDAPSAVPAARRFVRAADEEQRAD